MERTEVFLLFLQSLCKNPEMNSYHLHNLLIHLFSQSVVAHNEQKYKKSRQAHPGIGIFAISDIPRMHEMSHKFKFGSGRSRSICI
jgi:hypothetical protein